jgi:SWI/SNF-related matrix-associated actin-dependent regulator of chromatin subfamily A-like protein 1
LKLKINSVAVQTHHSEQQEDLSMFDVKKMKNDMVKIMVKNQKEVINAIGSLPNKKFSPINKDWLIPRRDISRLLKLLPDSIDENQRHMLEKISRVPLKHQEEARDFLVDRKKAILADEMGSGKTFSSILGANEVEGKKLVVCPSGLKFNWEKEISYTTDIRIDIIEDSKTWIKPVENGWTVISYDLLKEHIEEVINEGYVVAIFDEAHYCRAVTRKGLPKSFRARTLLQVSESVEYLFLLTGTPVVNGNKDLFILLKAIGHHLSHSWRQFAMRYCGAKIIGKGWTFDGNNNEEELFSLLQYRMLRRLKEEFADLPEKHREFISVSIDLTEYKEKVDEYMEGKNLTHKTGKQLVLLNAMRSIIAKEKCNHTIKLAEELIDNGESVVIFTNFEFVVNKVINYFGDEAVKITGKDTAKQRQERVNKFQRGEKKVIVCNLIAGGVGITLTKSTKLIFNDLSWLFAEHSQAEDRIHRISQTEECHIYYMYCKDARIDKVMIEKLERRMNSAGRTLDNKNESLAREVIELF